MFQCNSGEGVVDYIAIESQFAFNAISANHSVWLFVTDGSAVNQGFSFTYEIHNG